jgi:hypothetical protein
MPSYRKYYWGMLLGFLVPLLLTPVVAYVSLFKLKSFPHQVLFQHQIDKIDGTNKFDTVFLGDSSLGSALNARLFSDLSGRRCANLALNGLYGYAGSLNLLRRASEKQPIKNVVLMNTTPTLQRPIEFEGYVRSLESPMLIFKSKDIRLFYKAFVLYNNLSAYLDLARGLTGKGIQEAVVLTNDYVRQGKPFDVSRIKMFEPTVDPEKPIFLKEVQKLCAEKGYNLVYTHGPIVEDYRASAPYFELANKTLQGLGLNVVTNIIFFPREDMGDSDDHVSLAAKDKYTRVYWVLLKDRLK